MKKNQTKTQKKIQRSKNIQLIVMIIFMGVIIVLNFGLFGFLSAINWLFAMKFAYISRIGALFLGLQLVNIMIFAAIYYNIFRYVKEQ